MKPMLMSERLALPLEKRYPDNWPPIEHYVHESGITHAMVDGLEQLIEDCSPETAIDTYISENPVLLTALLDFNNTGHHAAWVVPKKKIRPKISREIPGLIPDFLVGGKNSFGITWYVVELKGAEHKLFTSSGKKLYLSGTANMGLCQVLEYMHFCNISQSMLRETMKLSELSYAEGFLFIGRSRETEKQRPKDLKASINKMNQNLQIRSYDSLVRMCRKFAMINAQTGGA
ncbi:MAG: DUF4263 domain-containing protein [Mariprofundus sp.]|nr:DUF4263 domain-containing protein [Mariprofundus sp.]